ncbi:MAG: SusD/RagB family nutrient-binding outer membrane lipoprotein [Bacteroidales bacterium]|nr:SusD/RagB family nutrient-binding outer membrane lipoprotein [Bacteroidales bacterium]
MRLKNIIYASVLTSGVLLNSCDKYLDVNHDPDYPEEVPAEQMMPSFEVGAAYSIMSWDFLFPMGIYQQYITQKTGASQFRAAESFEEENFTVTYTNFYTRQLLEAKVFQQRVGEESNMYAVAEIMSVYIWQVATDLWGDIPYSEALDNTNISPKFDKAEDIYTSLLSRIDAVRDGLANGKFTGAVSPKYDYVFGGDMSQWAAFANSLKLRMMLRLVNTGKFSYADIKTFAESNALLTKTAQISEKIWEAKTAKMYPLDEYENGGFPSLNAGASKSITSYMATDSRLKKIFTVDGEGNVNGKVQGAYTETETKTVSKLAPAVKNIPLISSWEIDFNLSEIYLKTGDNAKAEEYYKKAVDESFTYWTLAGQGEEVYGENGYAKWTSDESENFKTLNLQRWASFLMTQHAEGFFSRMRTGYPEYYSQKLGYEALNTDKFPVGYLVHPVCGTVMAGTPASLLYPASSVLNLNTNAPKQKSDLSVALFWHKSKSGK